MIKQSGMSAAAIEACKRIDEALDPYRVKDKPKPPEPDYTDSREAAKLWAAVFGV